MVTSVHYFVGNEYYLKSIIFSKLHVDALLPCQLTQTILRKVGCQSIKY